MFENFRVKTTRTSYVIRICRIERPEIKEWEAPKDNYTDIEHHEDFDEKIFLLKAINKLLPTNNNYEFSFV
ncbi:hypothetical protein RCL_jg17538.t1 [Rhizophagus clarus]|uniref:Uncharacterized protein n=1 Tax=Rhizophagus clarus TaxID=94130 RepID=A0A8H3KXX2_9GLOM|nr:hypothetical protein RCL_jg17538.t1 [Rhizophagus clarus]